MNKPPSCTLLFQERTLSLRQQASKTRILAEVLQLSCQLDMRSSRTKLSSQGQILAVQARIKGAKIRIVTIYLHPDKVHESLQALIKYLRNIDLREWTILAGDFNRADQQCNKAWHQLTEEYGFTDGHPTLPTFRTTTGETCLDRILLPHGLPTEPTA